MHVAKRERKVIKYRSYKQFDDSHFINDLEHTPFHVANIFDDIDDQLWFHNTLFNSVIDQHAPKKQRALKPNQLPFMNGELRKAINVKGMLRRKYDRYNTTDNKRKFRVQSNLVMALKRQSMKWYLNENCVKNQDENGNRKQFWDTIRPFMVDESKGSESIILKEDGHVVSDARDVANIFNEFFTNIAKDMSEPDDIDMNGPLENIVCKYDNHTSINEIRIRHNDENASFNFHAVTQTELLNKMMKIKTRKSCGYDDMPPRLVKLGAPVLSYSLLPIVNMSMECNVFPQDLKHAEISPLFKKEDKMNKEKYRPVSVLVCQSKLFESIMMDQLMDFFRHKLSEFLSAYRKGYSTQHVLLRALEDWKMAIDDGNYVGCVLMDLSKAFDAIPHGLLIAKLNAYGMSINACEMIRSYLCNRKQRVKIGNVRSEWQIIHRGIPQGSIAGPVLFNIFVNDLFYFLQGLCSLYNYADDNSLACSDKDLNVVKANLEQASQVAITWFGNNHMKANASKFQVLCITKDRIIPSLDLVINGVTLKSDSEVKLLGVYIDARLTFGYHVNEICKKAGNQVRAMARLCGMLDEKSRFLIFNAFIISNFMYCPIVWHMCSISDSKRLEKTQERALRYVLDDYDSLYCTMLENASVSTLYLSRLRILAMEIFKTVNGLNPAYMNSLFLMKESSHDLRQNLLVQPKCNSVTYGLRSIRYQGSKIWNCLPECMKNVESVSSFKRVIQKWNGPECHCGYCLQCTLKRI